MDEVEQNKQSEQSEQSEVERSEQKITLLVAKCKVCKASYKLAMKNVFSIMPYNIKCIHHNNHRIIQQLEYLIEYSFSRRQYPPDIMTTDELLVEFSLMETLP